MDQTQQAKSSFSFGRFLAFLKLLIVSNLFKVVLSSILSFIVTTGVLSLVVYATREFEGNKLVVLANVFYVGAALGVLFLIAIVCIFFAAGTFRSYNIRATAWNIVLLPATRSEKFVAHYIYACLFVPLIFIAAYLGRQCKGTKKSNRFTHFSPLVIEMSVTLLHFAVYQCATKPNFGV